MASVPPNVIIEECPSDEQEGADGPNETVLDRYPLNDETTPPTRTRRASWLQRRTSSNRPEDGSQDSISGNAFARLVKTVQFIKKWAGRAERPPDAREEFLGRFKMPVPNIDDAYDVPSDKDVERPDGTVQVSSKKKWRKIFLFNPTGSWLYRSAFYKYSMHYTSLIVLT